MNDHEMFDRLRRFGDTVDQAAVAAGAPAGPLRDVSDPLANGAGDLEPVVYIAGRRDRRYRAIVAAAAAVIVVVAGAIVTSRITASTDSGSTASNDQVGTSTTTTTTEPEETTPTTAAIGAAAASTVATTTSTTSTSSSTTSTTAPATTPPNDPVCPNYRYNVSYPIRICDKGPAVTVIQEQLGVDVDGFFGPGTQQAVRQFQRDHALEVDGLVGQDTWTALVPDIAIGDVGGTGTVEPNVLG